MRLFRTLALGASLLVLLGACSTGGGSKPTIKIGSDGFDEARVVAEVYAQVLEANGYTVDRAGIGLGARKVTAAALESGQIDLKPEYIGSGLALLRAGHPDQRLRPRTRRGLQTALTPKGGITVLGYTPAQDTNAFVVRKETADQFSLTKVERPDGAPERPQVGPGDGLPDQPGLRRGAQERLRHRTHAGDAARRLLRPMADALKQKTIDVAELCSTGPRSSSTAGSGSRTTRRRSRPTTSRRSSATTSWPRSTRRRSASSSTTSRPRSIPRRWPTCTSRSPSTRRTWPPWPRPGCSRRASIK